MISSLGAAGPLRQSTSSPPNDGTLAESGLSGLLTGVQSELLQIIQMSNMKSGSLTDKNGGTISLTPRDLENHYIAPFWRHNQLNPQGPQKPLHCSILQKSQRSGEIFLGSKVDLRGRVLLLKFQTLTHSLVEIISLSI